MQFVMFIPRNGVRVMLDVDADYYPYYPGSRHEPPEYECVEINSVKDANGDEVEVSEAEAALIERRGLQLVRSMRAEMEERYKEIRNS